VFKQLECDLLTVCLITISLCAVAHCYRGLHHSTHGLAITLSNSVNELRRYTGLITRHFSQN